jgi:hypothetical protein
MRLAKHCAILVAVGALELCTSPLAAIPIRYLKFPGGTTDGKVLTLPLDLELPCYGLVGVKVTPDTVGGPVPAVSYFVQKLAQGQSATDGTTTYTWGADTNRFNVLTSQDLDYNVTFTFTSPPDPTRLLLAVIGLREGSTATISTQPATPAGTRAGEFQFPATAATPSTPATLASAMTDFKGAVLSHMNDSNLDQANTGWALYRPQGSFTSLTVKMHQVAGDGFGWTLSYVCDSSLTVNKVGLNQFQPPPDGANAAQVTRAHPADLWHVQAVKPDIVAKFRRRLDRLTNAGNNVHLQCWQRRQSR